MIAVHSGAGNHHHSKHSKYRKLCKKSCLTGMNVLRAGGSSLAAITAAIKVLEDNPITNAGYGSNLTTLGEVECDAAVMDGSNLLYGGCACTTTIKNPIELASDLCRRQTEALPNGLVPPSLLVGKGATLHAKKHGIARIANKELITKRAERKLRSYKSILNEVNGHGGTQGEGKAALGDGVRMDTVGAVCCDLQGHVAAGCSSGGLLLKRPGRVGQGALYASGVWADSEDVNSHISVAATTSGCGEYLVRTQLAKEVCEDLKTSAFPTPELAKCFTNKFLNSRYLKTATNKDAGTLVVHVMPNGDGTLLWGHSTTSMAVGLMSIEDSKPKSIISILPPAATLGVSVMVGGANFKITKSATVPH